MGQPQQPRPAGISVSDWEATPEAVRQLVYSLLDTVVQLEQRVATLEEITNRNSRNSSQPPSSDPAYKRPPPKSKKSGGKRGGQKGHPGRGRKLKPPDQVSRVVISKPIACCACGALLLGSDPQPCRHQVCELPRIEPEVIEYQVHSLKFLACGTHNEGQWPAEMPSGRFGPRTQATIGYLSGRIGVSRRDTEEIMATLFHLDIALGSIPAQEQRVSQALTQPVAEAADFVRQQAAANVDETGWHEMQTDCWLWVCAPAAVTVFRITDNRRQAEAQQLLGPDYRGVVGSDRHSAYNWLDPDQRQACWSHLQRDFQAFVDRGGESAIIGSLLLAYRVKTPISVILSRGNSN